MKPEDLVTDLEISKRLKELGVPQKSLFIRRGYMLNRDGQPTSWTIEEAPMQHYSEEKYCIAAFTLSELIELMGDNLNMLEQGINEWVAISEGAMDEPDQGYAGKTPLEACAKLLIQLLESGEISFNKLP